MLRSGSLCILSWKKALADGWTKKTVSSSRISWKLKQCFNNYRQVGAAQGHVLRDKVVQLAQLQVSVDCCRGQEDFAAVWWTVPR